MRFPLLSKALAIGLVMVMLSAMLLRIDLLVSERRQREMQATASVQQSLAGAQTLLGPLLQRHCVEEWEATVGEGKDQRRETMRRESWLVATPQQLVVDGQLRSEPRYRGLFKVNGYAGPVTLEARFADASPLQPQREHVGSRLGCEPMRLLLAVGDVRGLRSAQVTVDGQSMAVQPGTGWPSHPRGLHVVMPAPRAEAPAATGPMVARVALDLLGTQRLALVPAAGDTQWRLRADWPHPSFGGRFLPVARDVGPQGFDARWTVSSLASAAAQDVARDAEVCAVQAWPGRGGDDGEAPAPLPSTKGASCLDTLSVAFIDPVNPYVLTDRASKYALLFIVLTFGAVALTEVMSRRGVHPVQYAFVGLALALFFLLLLSLAEHLPFDAAYAGAAAACIALLGFYARFMLGSWRAGLGFGGGVALLYGVLWALLQMEQTALVIGSVLLFGVLAAVMVATRHVDWYALLASWRRTAGPAA